MSAPSTWPPTRIGNAASSSPSSASTTSPLTRRVRGDVGFGYCFGYINALLQLLNQEG